MYSSNAITTARTQKKFNVIALRVTDGANVTIKVKGTFSVIDQSARTRIAAFCVTPTLPPAAAGQQGMAEQYHGDNGKRAQQV